MKQIQPNDLRYILITDAGETVLSHSPSGWEESLLNWKRDKEYFGMVRSFTMPMEFVAEGARILREEYYTNSLNAVTSIRIEQLQRSSWKYKTIFEGDMDYSKFSDGRNKVTINVMEGGISKMVNAYDGVEYDIPLDADAVTVIVPGIGTVDDASFIVLPNDYAYGFDFFDGGLKSIPAMDLVVNNLDNMAVTAQDVAGDSDFATNLFPTSDLWFAQAEADSKIRLKGNIKGDHRLQNSDQVIRLQIRDNSNAIIHTIASFVYQSTDLEVPFDVDFDFEFDITTGQRFFLVISPEGTNGNLPAGFDIDSMEVYLDNALITPDTECLAFRPFDLYRKILAKMNGGIPVPAQSFLLQGNWSRLLITCGDAIRQFPDPVIKTSFREFFGSINGLISCGFSVENGTAVLEAKPYFMRANSQAADIGTVKEFSLDPAVDFIFSSIKTGYSDQDYETDQGRLEYNSKQQWATPVDRVKGELNIMSPYRADQFGIEEQRLTPAEQNEDDRDKEWDNDVFMIKVKADPNIDGHYEVEGAEHYRELDGIQGAGTRNAYYNLDLTPKKNLLRHGDFLRSGLHRFGGRHLRFESATKNAELQTRDLDGVRVKERDWILISSLADPLFLPYVATVTSDYPRSILETLTSFPYGYIRFRYRGYTWKGFILEANVDVARSSAREFKLLLTPDNNVLNFVH